MNKIGKAGIFACAVLASLTLCAYPGRYHGHHHHHHGGTGLAIGAGILGVGLLASAIYDATHPAPPPVVVTPTPVVPAAPVVVQQQPVVVQQPVAVQQPVVVQTGHYETRTQNVWVEGRYVDQMNANGSAVRTWQPGHYEQQQTQVWVP